MNPNLIVHSQFQSLNPLSIPSQFSPSFLRQITCNSVSHRLHSRRRNDSLRGMTDIQDAQDHRPATIIHSLYGSFVLMHINVCVNFLLKITITFIFFIKSIIPFTTFKAHILDLDLFFYIITVLKECVLQSTVR